MPPLCKLPARRFQGGREGGGGDDAAVRHLLPGQQVGVVLDVQVEDFAGGPAVPRGRQPASRFRESVVFRVKMTESSGRPPTKLPHNVRGHSRRRRC